MQRLDAIWHLSLLAFVLVFNWVIYFLIGNDDLTFFYVTLGSTIVLLTLLSMMKMKTKYDQEGVTVSILPMVQSAVTYKWKDVTNINIEKYHFLKHAKGRGAKRTPKAIYYTLNGDIGLVFNHNSKRVLIGLKDEAVVHDFLKAKNLMQ